jgi:ADP-ribosylglycohydrolase
MPTHEERIEGGLVGLLVGDALGVPYEFHPLERLPPRDEIEFVPPEWFRRAHAGTPLGTRSDDGAQVLALLASLLERDWLNPDVLGRPLLAWYERGDYAADHRVFDVGIQIGWALRALREGVPAPEAGPAAELSNGNGSLMRVLPLALWHRGDDAELVADARLQSRVTHGHIRSQTCCALSCFWARRMLEGADDPWGRGGRGPAHARRGRPRADRRAGGDGPTRRTARRPGQRLRPRLPLLGAVGRRGRAVRASGQGRRRSGERHRHDGLHRRWDRRPTGRHRRDPRPQAAGAPGPRQPRSPARAPQRPQHDFSRLGRDFQRKPTEPISACKAFIFQELYRIIVSTTDPRFGD